MKKLELNLNDIALSAIILTVLIFCFSTFNWASAKIKPNNKPQTLEKNILSEYKSAKIRCASFISNLKTFCENNADIEKNKSLADLDSIYVPTHQQQKEKYNDFITEQSDDSEQFTYKNNPFDSIEPDQIYSVKT